MRYSIEECRSRSQMIPLVDCTPQLALILIPHTHFHKVNKKNKDQIRLHLFFHVAKGPALSFHHAKPVHFFSNLIRKQRKTKFYFISQSGIGNQRYTKKKALLLRNARVFCLITTNAESAISKDRRNNMGLDMVVNKEVKDQLLWMMPWNRYYRWNKLNQLLLTHSLEQLSKCLMYG